jgi:hypothetical protein
MANAVRTISKIVAAARGGGMGGGGLPAAALFAILRRIGIRGILIVGVVLAGVWFFAPRASRK